MEMFVRLFICLGLLAGSLAAQGVDSLAHVAVIPVTGGQNIEAEQLSFITGQFAAELVKTRSFTVLDRGQMEYILQEQGFQQSGACNSSKCQVQIGQLLGVDYIVAGSLVRFGSTYAFRADYIEVASGKVLYAVNQKEEGALEDVYESLCSSIARQLARSVQPARVPAPGELAQESGAGLSLGESPQALSSAPAGRSNSLSVKRKIALALWGSSLLGAGAGWYFNGQGLDASDNYSAAEKTEDAAALRAAGSDMDAAALNRNVSYSYAVGALVVGAALWIWGN